MYRARSGISTPQEELTVKRRDFLTTSCVAGAMPLGLASAASAADSDPRQYLELRRYHLHAGPKKGLVGDFLKDVGIPALNRLGVGPVGVFTAMYGPSQPTLYVLMQHPSLESAITLSDRLLADEEFTKSGADFLNAPLSDPMYVRFDRWLMRGFPKMPCIEVPPQTAEKKPRIFELRTYESHSVKAGKKKVEMFNAGGEIAIFRKTGLQPVFFGETLIGPRMPNLTYMVVFDDMVARDAAWKAFVSDPDWATLKTEPQYLDTVSNITDFILRPTGFSQL